MNFNLFLYLIKVLAFSGMGYGYFCFFLRNKNFHRFNHLFLFATVIGSVVVGFVRIPLAVLPGASFEAPVNILTAITRKPWENEGIEPVKSSFNGTGFNWQAFAGIIYAIVSGFFISRIIASSLKMGRLLRALMHLKGIGNTRLFCIDEPGTPFSFFNNIFWDPAIDRHSVTGRQVFRHEWFHVTNRHTTEILFYEFMVSVFWFNPFFHLAKKEIRLIQEFEADQFAIAGTNPYEYAQLLLNYAAQPGNQLIPHHFFHHPIKRRITMITKMKAKQLRNLGRLLALPALLLLTGAFTLRLQQKNSAVRLPMAPEKITILVDAGHGGIDPGVHAVTGELEKNLSLAIAQKIKTLSNDYPVNVILSRDGDFLPGSATTIREGLEKRAQLAGQVKASLFISIHMNGDADITKNGATIVVSADNRKSPWLQQSKILGSTMVSSLRNILPVDEKLQQSETGVYVLDKSPCPAIIVECGYITNGKDLEFLNQESNQTRLAKHYSRSSLAVRKMLANKFYFRQHENLFIPRFHIHIRLFPASQKTGRDLY